MTKEELEKEAEEYREKEKDKGYYWVTQEMEQSELDTIVDESFKDGAEFGYNKANEWHYVKDELPPIKENYNGRSELVLVVSEEKEMEYAQWVEKEKTWARGICEIRFKPYAWKEIVLPELPKEIKENE